MYEYEQILTGQRTSISNFYFSNGEEMSEQNALMVVRYAMEYFLRWSPDDIYNHFDANVIERMKLKCVMGHIRYPIELDPKQDYYYIAALLYPYRYKMGLKELTLKTYKDVLSGKRAKFPKEYLVESQGMLRACICLQYMITQYLKFSSVQEMYQFFGEREGIRTLKKYHLFAICNDFFPTPIDFLHMSLSTAQKNDFYFSYYKFQKENGVQIRRMKKYKTFIM